jgi:hypothetical protein
MYLFTMTQFKMKLMFYILADNFAIRDPYDRVLSCLGFKVG